MFTRDDATGVTEINDTVSITMITIMKTMVLLSMMINVTFTLVNLITLTMMFIMTPWQCHIDDQLHM